MPRTFFDLPREIRDEIYRLCLQGGPIHVCFGESMRHTVEEFWPKFDLDDVKPIAQARPKRGLPGLPGTVIGIKRPATDAAELEKLSEREKGRDLSMFCVSRAFHEEASRMFHEHVRLIVSIPCCACWKSWPRPEGYRISSASQRIARLMSYGSLSPRKIVMKDLAKFQNFEFRATIRVCLMYKASNMTDDMLEVAARNMNQYVSVLAQKGAIRSLRLVVCEEEYQSRGQTRSEVDLEKFRPIFAGFARLNNVRAVTIRYVYFEKYFDKDPFEMYAISRNHGWKTLQDLEPNGGFRSEDERMRS
ncbi:MAG: hypothetical protein M1828_005127 [Chrysothrix sp. TS-e1954]|nr:MAG: hypothetical protein M1828_005127 [Chrysothrix sp. TS-e1954]